MNISLSNMSNVTFPRVKSHNSSLNSNNDDVKSPFKGRRQGYDNL